jgi:hypothetical protein
VVVPDVALAVALMVMFCAVPGVRLSVAGFAVTPGGRPVIATAIVPVNAFKAVAVTLSCEPAAPAIRGRVDGETARVKSGAGAMVKEMVTE